MNLITPLVPSDRTGPLPYTAGNWNVALNEGGVLTNLVEEIDGEAHPTSATVVWEATGIASSAVTAPNFFQGSDLKLMSGHLDQDINHPFPTFIQITDIPDELAASYDVVIYTLVISPNLGAEYTVNGSAPAFVLPGGNGVFNGPDFVEVPTGMDSTFGTDDWGNYVVFRGVSGNTVTITAANRLGGKAPVNGVQIANAHP
jgi:hypothetical protein